MHQIKWDSKTPVIDRGLGEEVHGFGDWAIEYGQKQPEQAMWNHPYEDLMSSWAYM